MTVITKDPHTPPIHRFSMVYHAWNHKEQASSTWSRKLIYRRFLFLTLVLVSALFAVNMMAITLGAPSLSKLQWAIVGIFTVLFIWICIAFWTTFLGFLILMSRKTPLSIRDFLGAIQHIQQETLTAIVLPIYNEDVSRVFCGLRVVYESIRKTGELDNFHFFVLSDTNDSDLGDMEEKAWKNFCDQTNGYGRVFYRRRKCRVHKKSGNISDFCRRWGKQYTYMIILDADSLMSGQLILNMVGIMESRKDIGILQTAPLAINQKSLIARINQFASHLYGPLMLAGLHFLQLDEGAFWGHNAIVRLSPFMQFCALPVLGGSPPFGGEILSHDFIEAALMKRAGFGVWLAYNLEGSYEELPPNLLDELKRDARWCKGNLQHLRLMFMKGLAPGHRLLFFNGNMFYASSLLWFLLLVLMTVNGVEKIFYKPHYFSGYGLFPNWPIEHGELSLKLLLLTASFLFLPKLLSVVWAVCSGKLAFFGGLGRMLLSVLLEIIFSILLAPLRMFFHSGFLIKALSASKHDWIAQSRSLQRISLVEAFKSFWGCTALGLVWATLALAIDQTLFLWISVIALPWALSIPIAIGSSLPKTGALFKHGGFFLTPEETHPSREVVRLKELTEQPP